MEVERSIKVVRLNRLGTLSMVFLVGIVLTGCGHSASDPTNSPGLPNAAKSNPMEEQYKKLRSADNAVDSTVQEIDDSMEASKNLAPKAGGDAQKALADVVALLDGAGELIGDYEPVSETFDEFTKDFAAQDDRRLRAIKTCNDAIAKISDALDVVSDLLANVPDAFKGDLQAIGDNVKQAKSDLGQAVLDMGGKLADQVKSESVDPDQEKP